MMFMACFLVFVPELFISFLLSLIQRAFIFIQNMGTPYWDLLISVMSLAKDSLGLVLFPT